MGYGDKGRGVSSPASVVSSPRRVQGGARSKTHFSVFLQLYADALSENSVSCQIWGRARPRFEGAITPPPRLNVEPRLDITALQNTDTCTYYIETYLITIAIIAAVLPHPVQGG